MTVLLPSRGMTWDAAGLSLFTATWVGFVGLWTAGALLSGGGLMALFSAPFWAAGAQLGRQTADTCFLTETLDVHRDQWTLRQVRSAECGWVQGTGTGAAGVSSHCCARQCPGSRALAEVGAEEAAGGRRGGL